MAFQDGERLLTMADVAERLAFSSETHRRPNLAAKRWCQSQRIGGMVGRYYRVPASALDEALRRALSGNRRDLREKLL